MATGLHRADQNYQASMVVIYGNTALFPVAADGTRCGTEVPPDPRQEGFGPVGRVSAVIKTRIPGTQLRYPGCLPKSRSTIKTFGCL